MYVFFCFVMIWKKISMSKNDTNKMKKLKKKKQKKQKKKCKMGDWK